MSTFWFPYFGILGLLIILFLFYQQYINSNDNDKPIRKYYNNIRKLMEDRYFKAFGQEISDFSCLTHHLSEGLINDAIIVSHIIKDLDNKPFFRFENTHNFDGNQNNDWLFVNLDITNFNSLFNNKKSPRNILCKNLVTYETLINIAPPDFNIMHSGFTSIDRYISNISKDYNKCLHIAGKSPAKNSEVLVRAWLKHPEWPHLTILCREKPLANVKRIINNSKTPQPKNINIIEGLIPVDDLHILMNECGIHICPSKYEGFGHYLNEARSVGAVVLYTDGPPMNEMFQDNISGLAIKCNVKLKGIIPKSYVNISDIETTMSKLLIINKKGMVQMGQNSRTSYLNDKHEFMSKFIYLINKYFVTDK